MFAVENVPGYKHVFQQSSEYACSGFVDTVRYGYEFHGFTPEHWPPYLSDFLPFQQNYVYRNFVWDSATAIWAGDGTADGAPGNGLVNAPFNNVPYMVMLGQAGWSFLTYNYLSGGLRAGIAKVLPDSYYTVGDGGPWNQSAVTLGNSVNIYGLQYSSAEVANGSTPLSKFQEVFPGDAVNNANGFVYVKVDAPSLTTVGYYFAPANGTLNEYWLTADYPTATMPGDNKFTPSDQPPIILASVGEQIRILGWAKQKINNGYDNKFGYLGQYFQPSASSAGILSEYGEFLPSVPGNVTINTKPDPNQHNSVGQCNIHVISLDVDGNRDGVIDPSLVGCDKTSYESRFAFWINNDYDRSLMDADDQALYDDSATPAQGDNVQDCDFKDANGKRVIPTQRDLEDFARLWVSGFTPDLLAKLPPGTTVTLDWGDVGAALSTHPTIDLFQAADGDGGAGYLNEVGSSILQVSSTLHPYVGRLAPGQQLQLNASQFAGNWAGNHFIWCGVERGSGTLYLTVSHNGQVLAQSAVYITLKDIKEMYERWTVGDIALKNPLATALLAVEELPTKADAFQYGPLADQNTPYILFVHGWNMSRYDKDRFAETAFKRLYWQGYKGRFGLFRWPTDYGFAGDLLNWSNPLTDPHNFDNSENTAWNSAAGLLKKLKDLNRLYPGHVYLLAHSMGNVVAGEALRLGASQATGAIVNTYVATQGAIPAHVYDAACNNLIDYAHTNEKIPKVFRRTTWGYDTPNIYGDRLRDNSAAVGRRINYYNINDFALSEDSWCFNQEWKPDMFVGGSFGYTGTINDPSPWNHFWMSGYMSVNLDIVNNIQDLYQAMAFAAESRSKALGATPGVNNMTRDQDLSKLWPPDLSNNNYKAHFWHSAQFRGACWGQWGYWNKLLYSDTGFSITK